MPKKEKPMMYTTAGIKSIYWYDLYFIKIETEIGINALLMLCSNQEDGLKAVKTKFETDLSNDAFYESLDEEQKSSYRSQIYGSIDSIHEELERQQRFSMCMSAYSFFEGRLREVCILIEDTFEFKIKISDLNSQQDLMLYSNYLEKIFEVDLRAVERFFTPINQQKRTRNIIAHQDGWASETQAKRLVSKDGLSIDKRGSRFKIEIIKPSYLTNLINDMNSYFNALFPILEDRYNDLTEKKEG